jgi:hypothetical protein
VAAAVGRRIPIAQALYALGTAPCVFDTRTSIAFIAAVQLFYVLGPDFQPGRCGPRPNPGGIEWKRGKPK